MRLRSKQRTHDYPHDYMTTTVHDYDHLYLRPRLRLRLLSTECVRYLHHGQQVLVRLGLWPVEVGRAELTQSVQVGPLPPVLIYIHT